VPGARVTAAGLATTPAMAEACGEAGGGGGHARDPVIPEQMTR